MILRNGGRGPVELIGNIRRDQAAHLKEKIISLWFMFHGMTLMLMRNGLANDCRRKPSGNMRQEAEKWVSLFRGEMKLLKLASLRPIHGRAIFQTIIRVGMDLKEVLQSKVLRSMVMVFLIWPEMYGNGAATGTMAVITLN